MSNLNFAEFANTLQAAQTAIDNAPKLEQERDNALKARDDAQRHNEAIELRIRDLSGTIATLQTQLREAEDARDTFRLEAHATTAKLDRLVSAFTSASDMVADEIRQVMPQPEPTPEPAPVPLDAGSTDASGSSSGQQSETQPSPVADPGPAIGSVHPYAGKAYHDHPVFVSYHAWLDGGGTDYGYNWMPSAPGDQPIQSRLSAQPEVLSDGKPQSESIGYGSDQKRYY